MSAVIIVCILICLYYGITRGIPWLLSWLVILRYKTEIRIGLISILRLSFEDLLIKKSGVRIEVKRVGASSSLFNQDEHKIFALKIYDVRIETEITDSKNATKLKEKQENPLDQIEAVFCQAQEMAMQDKPDALHVRIPPSIVTLAQFFGIHIMGVSLMYLREKWPECLIYASAKEIKIEGATLNQTNIASTISIDGAHIRMLQNTEKTSFENTAEKTEFDSRDNRSILRFRKDSTSRHALQLSTVNPSLVELHLSLKFTVEANAETNVSEMESLSLSIVDLGITLQERFFTFLEQKAMVATPVMCKTSISQPFTHLLYKYWLLIPLKTRLKIGSTNLEFVTALGKSSTLGLSEFDFYSHLSREGALGNFPALLPDLCAELRIENVSVHCIYSSVASVSKIIFQVLLVGDQINMKMEIHSLNGFYDYQDLSAWKEISMRKRQQGNYMTSQPFIVEPDNYSNRISAFKNYCFGLVIEVWDVTVSAQLPDAPLCMMYLQNARHGSTLSNGLKVFGGEILVDSLVGTVSTDASKCAAKPSLVVSKRSHSWGTLLFIGFCLIKMSNIPNTSNDNIVLQLEALLDNVRCEWSLKVATFVVAFVRYVMDNMKHLPRKTLQRSRRKIFFDILNSTKIKFTNVNIFAHTDMKVSSVMRLDEVESLISSNYYKLLIKGAKCIKFLPSQGYYLFVKSSELEPGWIYLTDLVAEFVNGETLVNINDRFCVIWSTATHLLLFTIIKEMANFVKTLKLHLAEFGAKGESVAHSEGLKLQVILNGDIRVGAHLSKYHQLNLLLGDFTYLMAKGKILCQTDSILFNFDEHTIMALEKAKLTYFLQSRELREERESFEKLLEKQNRAWKLTVDLWELNFPHEYRFCDAFSEDLISLVKWLKIVHNYKPTPFTLESRLPPDIVIKVNKWSAVVCDDPFEVKLRYNYELIEDEYAEACKRLKALESRIEDLRKATFLLPSSKIEELYKNLQEKNSETYIKRSKQMYESAPVRTQLFTWTMENVTVFAMADYSFHGHERVMECMREIDPDSPWPEEGLEFSTLWCRMISASCSAWLIKLRDYPQPLLDISDMEIWGRLIGAEQMAAKRARRSITVEIEDPWEDVPVERSMTALKFYHDFECEIKSFTAAYGPCWEPAMAQFNIAMNLVNRPTIDPSTPLPWWDKMRLLLHGRLTMIVERMTLLLHASLDPYNTTEEMELTWTDLNLDWSNAKIIFKGDLNVYVRTASKYDDARLISLPNLKLTIKLEWMSHSNPNDHHSVMLCAPDKLPEYSSNQEHDSYRVFRSQNLNVNIGLETRVQKKSSACTPVIELLFYGSTLRWFENLKFILSGVLRPTRKGALFNVLKGRRPQLSRHYRTIHLSLSFQRFDIRYWMSVGVKKGFHMSGERLLLSSEHSLSLVPIKDGLYHRPRTSWSIVFINTVLSHAQIWLQSAMSEEPEEKEPSEDGHPLGSSHSLTDSISQKSMPSSQPIEKFYFLNVSEVAYSHECLAPPSFTPTPGGDSALVDKPDHRLVVHDLKGAWTTNNRDILFALHDSWNKVQQLRCNLASDIIKSFTPDKSSTPQKIHRQWNSTEGTSQSLTSPTANVQASSLQTTPSPMTRLQSGGHAQVMLQQLIAEADNNHVAFSEDCSNTEKRDYVLQGVKACTLDDVRHKKWLIELVNSQVLLKGCDTNGYVILSAAKAQVHQRVHRPVWSDQSIVMKTTWNGLLECMQYYATVSAGNNDVQMENIMWLKLENIEAKEGQVINQVPDIVGSGQSVGGVVSQTVGVIDKDTEPLQLQRIVSRCQCEFYFVSYNETGLDPYLLDEVQPAAPEDELWSTSVEAVDTFTLMHHDLCISTNSLQYNMVVDILNNLLLYVDPKKKEASEALARMRFQLQLNSREDQRRPIIHLQNQIRYHMSQQRSLEKSVYIIQRQLDKDGADIHLLHEKTRFEAQVAERKERVNNLSQELAMRIQCYNEAQVSANINLSTSGGEKKKVKMIRMNEVCFRKAQWRLTEADGQLGIADVVLSNFLYTRKANSDDSGEHLFELGYINVQNRLPNQMYSQVLSPTGLHANMPVDRQRTLRIFCREKAPCGGISVIDHFEINVVPLNIELTYQFFKTMMKFCFPDNVSLEENSIKEFSSQAVEGKGGKGGKRNKKKESSFYVRLQKDDVEIMKQRAEQNKVFVYIKIPELPVKLSYKGKKEKNIEDVTNFRLVIPTLEYHNVTWTWLDFLMAIKSGAKSALLAQAIKHKLNISHFRNDDAATLSEDEKARLLLGSKLLPPESKGMKKNLFKFNR